MVIWSGSPLGVYAQEQLRRINLAESAEVLKLLMNTGKVHRRDC